MTDAELMRVTAANYRLLAERQTDPRESEKYRAYASVYDQLATRREQGQRYERPMAPEKLD